MELLKKLPSPIGRSHDELIDLLLHEEYGFLPSAPIEVTASSDSTDTRFCAGKAELKHMTLHCKAAWGEFSFPFTYSCPTKVQKPVPAFMHINFRDLIPDAYQPTEEITDHGYAVLTFCYKDVTSDDGDFTNGLAGVVYPDGTRAPDQCGKIGLWAWAAMALMDYAMTLPELDHGRISVCGHSRLGKTALLAGALDKRFCCAFSNDSGCSGAALAREAEGETIEVITKVFPYWFSEDYKRYVNCEDKMPFDQHFLLAANAHHLVYVASAEEDLWASPKNEYLSCVAASGYFKALGKVGFVHPDRLPTVGDAFQDGSIGYHLRGGKNYLSRDDWNRYFEYLEKHS